MSDPKGETVVLEKPDWAADRDEQHSAVLVVVQGREIGRRYLLNQPRLILGRDAERADLLIEDAGVSGKHALVQGDKASGRYGLIDLGSLNGTFLNGRPVESSALREGDKIFVGETVLKFTFHGSIEDDYHSQLNEIMHVDSLSGLYVRRWFDREYPRAFERAVAGGCALSVLMMDMDGLKAINDQHGHQLGSWCIAETGKLIKRELGEHGVGARFGGDEFAAYLPGAGIETALRCAESIRMAVEQFEFHRDEIVVAPTISIGVALLSPQIAGAEELLRHADDALYRAKRGGRNAVAAPE